MYIIIYKFFIMKKNIYLVALHKIWIWHKKLHIIFRDNQNYELFFNSISFSILKQYGFSDKQAEFILENKASLIFDNIEKDLNSRNVDIVTICDENYPDLLKQIPNIPYLFYLRWKIDNWPKLSVVWTRLISSYWEKAIEYIIWQVSKYFTIVSWWAAWCDSKAHRICLENNTKTISVIGTGIDIDYPVWNKKLYDEIVEKNWAVISIFPLWEVGNPYNFPVRNEIVAWLSVWTVVIEARKKSWTLITSNLALDMWKDLFAVPWDIFKLNSEWCNNLIKNWMAKLVSSPSDILEEYNISENVNKKKVNKIVFEDEIEEKIYNILILESLTIDELLNKIDNNISTVSFKLSMMEINNIIKKWFCWKYEVF